MSTIANVLKSEIARVARKEVKAEVLALRKATSAHRSEIATLKREIKTLAGFVKQLQKGIAADAARAGAVAVTAGRGGQLQAHAGTGTVASKRRADFNAEVLLARRAALGLTQAQMARLIGASALSVYKWESGKARPRAAQQEQIASALQLGKRAAWARLNNLQA